MADVFAVFEGGGIKGIAHVGALARFQEEEPNLEFRGYAGTSAGAIVAALAAVGYRARNPSLLPSSLTPQDLNMIMRALDFNKLLGDGPVPFNKLRANIESFKSGIPRLVKAGKELQELARAGMWKRWSSARALLQEYQPELEMIQDLPELLHRFSVNKGLYDTGALIRWLQGYLNCPELVDKKRGTLTFQSLEDASKKILKIVATDLLSPEPHIFGPIDSRNKEVASAIQASISIPLLFCPYPEGSKLLVDGGLRSNYPLWIFDKERQQNGVVLPIIGFRLEQKYVDVHNQSLLEDYIWGLVNAALEGPGWLQGRKTERVVEVSVTVPAHIRATDFDLDDRDRDILFYSGYLAAGAALSKRENRDILGLP